MHLRGRYPAAFLISQVSTLLIPQPASLMGSLWSPALVKADRCTSHVPDATRKAILEVSRTELLLLFVRDDGSPEESFSWDIQGSDGLLESAQRSGQLFTATEYLSHVSSGDAEW